MKYFRFSLDDDVALLDGLSNFVSVLAPLKACLLLLWMNKLDTNAIFVYI